MDPLTIVLIILGVLLACIGGIVLLVAAFRENVWWGLASLFLPFASLIFVMCHWARAKIGFALSMLGSVILIGACFHAAPQLRDAVQKFAILPPAGLLKQTPEKDSTAQIQEKRAAIERLEAQFAQDGASLAKRFDALTAHRKSLKNDDAAAIAQFNAEAATYQAQNESRKLAKQEIDATRQDLETLLDERARTAASRPIVPQPDTVPDVVARPPAVKPAGAAKRVVMYTTATCPACVAAKSYMARKGIPYEEHDVNRSPEARAEFQRLGGRGVPLIIVGSERMEGFSPQRLEQML